MNFERMVKTAILIGLLVSLTPQPAWAYIGPGTGLSAIGAFLAVLAGIFVAIFGFLWYPIKKLLRKRKKASRADFQESAE
ncbi:MAG: hypothetical protein WEB58_00510 [Planctomycetaceae bacterium]